MFFAPKYVSQAQEIVKNVTRILNYRRDILPAEAFSRLSAKNDELARAAKQRDRGLVDRLAGELDDEIGKVVQRMATPAFAKTARRF